MKSLLLGCFLIVITTGCNHAYVIDLGDVHRLNAMPEEAREKAVVSARLENKLDGPPVLVRADRLLLAKATWTDSTSLRTPVKRPYGKFAIGAVAFGISIALIGLASANQADRSCEITQGYGTSYGLGCLERNLQTVLVGIAGGVVGAVGLGFTASAAGQWSPEAVSP